MKLFQMTFENCLFETYRLLYYESRVKSLKEKHLEHCKIKVRVATFDSYRLIRVCLCTQRLRRKLKEKSLKLTASLRSHGQLDIKKMR